MRDLVAPSRRASFVLLGGGAEERDRPAATLSRLDRLYRQLARHYDPVQPPTTVELVWSQQPPLEPHLLRETIFRQRDFFSGPTSVSNLLRTSLQDLSEELAELCSAGAVGDADLAAEVSIPLYETSAGIDASDALLSRAAGLIERGVRLRCATVLSKANHERIGEIVDAYRRQPAIVGWSLEPLLRTDGDGARSERNGHLEPDEATAALLAAVDRCGGASAARSVAPLGDLIGRVDRYRDPTLAPSFFSRRLWDPRFVVHGAGVIRGAGDAVSRAAAYGDLEQDDLTSILSGAVYLRSVEAAERRMATTCARCRFFGGCDGQPVAEAPSPEPPGCLVVRPLLDQIDRCIDGSAAESEAARSELLPGARLYLLVDSPDDRVTLSSGTTPPPAGGPARYHVGAIVPREPWMRPTAEQQRTIVSGPPPSTLEAWSLGSSVAVVTLPESAIAPLREVCRDCGLYGDDGPLAGVPHDRHPGWSAAHRTLLDHVWPFLLDGRPVDATTFYRGDPGQPTVTRTDRGMAEREALTGLHLDSWEGTPLRQRHRVRNRLCVNLGDEDRHFLYVNLTLDQMMRAAGLHDGDDIRAINLFVGRRFFVRFPDYPVVRVRVAPGEAYIAPTGNLVHDGDSLNKTQPDLALHLLGYFGVAAS